MAALTFDEFTPQAGGGLTFDEFAPAVGRTRTIADQAGQGLSFGTADEIGAGLQGGAKYAADKYLKGVDYIAKNLNNAVYGIPNQGVIPEGSLPSVNQSIGQDYTDSLANTRQDLHDEMQQRPALSIGSNLAGAVAPLVLSGGSSATPTISNWLRGGSLLARTAKGATIGAAAGGAYGFGAGEGDLSNRLDSAGENALIGGVTGGAVPVAGAALSDVAKTGKNAAQGLFARSPEAIQDIADNLKSSAGGLYDKMRSIGATLNANSGQTLINNIMTGLNQKSFIPQLNPKTLAIVDHIQNVWKNGNIGIDELDQYRRMLGRIGNTEDGVAAGTVRKAIDDHINSLTGNDLANGSKDAIDLLNQGRAAYAQASKFGDVSDILQKAAGDPNQIKAGLTRFLNNANNLRGWSGQEVQALKDAASTGGTEKLLKMGGKFGLDLGHSLTPGNTVAPLIGGYVNPAIPVAGTISRYGQKLAARGGAENLLNVLESGGGKAATTPISPLLSAPAGGVAGQLPQQMPVNASPSLASPLTATGVIGGAAALAMPDQSQGSQPQNQPQPAPQSNAAPLQPQDGLFAKVIHAESAGNQSAVSPKGAIGVAQIMPGTAKEAAADAGLPWDPIKYRTDPNYNAALGKAYLGKLQTKYQNDALALMAYNWGPGNVDMWIKSGSKLERVPQETRKYLTKILG